MIELGLIVLAVLIIISIMDVSTKTVPSVLPSTIILILVIVLGTLHYQSVIWGFAGLILGLILWEMNFFRGIADIKVTTIIGLCAGSMYNFLVFMILFAVVIGGFVILNMVRKTDGKDVAFLPFLTLVYLFLLYGGFVIF